MKLLAGKLSIVTGAARGIGAAIAVKLAEHGSDIAFSYVSDSSAEKAAALEQQLLALGVRAKAYKSNAGDFGQCETFVNDVLKEFGKVDVCVNNAGISKDNLLLRMSAEQWDDVMGINLKSVFNMTKQVIRPMMKAKAGSIINMSSIVGVRGNAGQSSYAASKAGIIGFTKSVALELGSRNIRCNAIAPGFVETDMTHYLKEGEGASEFLKKIPLGRFGTAAEIADTTLFLASDMASYITGQVLSVCGGLIFNGLIYIQLHSVLTILTMLIRHCLLISPLNMRKNFSTVFLLLVLSIQALPVKQMGLALFSNQFTEELPHSFDTAKDGCKKADLKSDFIGTAVFALPADCINAEITPRVAAAAIPQNHTGDIHVPPPNC